MTTMKSKDKFHLYTSQVQCQKTLLLGFVLWVEFPPRIRFLMAKTPNF